MLFVEMWRKPLQTLSLKIKPLLSEMAGITSLSERVELISASFLNTPYLIAPLEGSDKTEEKFTVKLGKFDCVTFCETVLALSFADSCESFLAILKKIRYSGNSVKWTERNHYSVDWISSNEEKGFILNITPGKLSVKISRTLNCLEGFPPQQRTISYLPTEKISCFSQSIQTGDLICFGTTCENLDVKHMGILIWQENKLILRHASKRGGKVMDECLWEFLGKFGKSPGVVLARPVQKG